MTITVEHLRTARTRSGLSQAAIASRMGTTQSAVARLEAERSDPRLSTVERYADAIGAQVVVQSNAMTLERTADQIRAELDNESPEDALRVVVQFLDDLRRLDPEGQANALRAEPDSVGDRRWDALVAGVAEHASHAYDLRIPGWTAAPGRFLTTFWFVIEDILGRPAPGLASLAFVGSPPALASRGVFLDRTSLVSV